MGFYPFTLALKGPGTDAEARQFPKRAGYDEDPATGWRRATWALTWLVIRALEKAGMATA